jgi:RNA polymerase sporulation-specific sigma factor
MYIRKRSNARCEISIDEPLNVDWDGNELLLSDVLSSDEDTVGIRLEMDEEKKTLHSALTCLSKREREIIELRFGLRDGKEYTQKDVATMLGISQSYISRLEKRSIARLRREINNA